MDLWKGFSPTLEEQGERKVNEMVVLRWLGRNIGTMLLAFVLALVVWVSSVTANDPNVEQAFQRPIDIEVRNLDNGLIIKEDIPTQVRVWLIAPSTRWRDMQVAEQPITAWIDLEGLGAGEHIVPVEVRVNPNINPVRVVQRTPSEIAVVLEPEVSRDFPVTLIVDGEPAQGYQAEDHLYSPEQVTIRGAQSLVSRIAEVRAYVDISGAMNSIETSVPLEVLDANGERIEDEEIRVNPESIDIEIPVSLLGGYRNVIVKMVYSGRLADGYKLTNITVSPPSVVVFSSDLQLLNDLPGYVETEPLDLTDVEDDVEAFLELNLPEGIEVPNNSKVLVQVNIAAIESNLALSLPVEVVGLQRGLAAQVAPTTVDIIFSGPLPILNTLKPSDIRVVADLAGREVGVHQITPTVTFLPDRVQLESVLPSSLEVSITIAPTPTQTPTPSTENTPTPTASPTPQG